jgi:uncharacterized phage-associated protein
MENKNTKIQYFEYFLDKVYNYLGKGDDNDLSIVKTQKLLFFLASSFEGENKDYPLFKVFDNFYALPYGHVESDIYKAIKGEGDFLLESFKIDRFGAKRNDNSSINVINDLIVDRLDSGFNELIEYNIIHKSSSYLVDLSHCHDSWIKNYRLALSLNKLSQFIPNNDLSTEKKYFSL